MLKMIRPYLEIIKIKTIPNNNNLINLKIRLTKFCNWDCSYCIQGHNKPKKPSDESIKESIDFLIQELKDKKLDEKDIELGIIGGEVSLFNIKDLILSPLIKSNIKIKKINIISNLSRDINWYKDLITYSKANNIKYFLRFSFHEDFITKETFLKKVKELIDFDGDNKKFTLEAVVNNNNFNIIKSFFNLKKKMFKEDVKLNLDADTVNINLNQEILSFIEEVDKNDKIKKNFEVYFRGNKLHPLLFNRNDIVDLYPLKRFPSKGFLCKEKLLSLIYDVPLKKLTGACNINAEDEYICDKDYCRLCHKYVNLSKKIC